MQERRRAPTPTPATVHDHAAPGRVARPGVIQPAVLELIPVQLHLDRLQVAALRSTLTDTVGCARKRLAVIANGAKGGIWVEAVR
jgi:hypothetical protein